MNISYYTGKLLVVDSIPAPQCRSTHSKKDGPNRCQALPDTAHDQLQKGICSHPHHRPTESICPNQKTWPKLFEKLMPITRLWGVFGVEGPRCHYWRRNTSAQDRNELKCLGAQTVEAKCRLHETWIGGAKNALCAMPFQSLVLYCSVVMSVVTEMNHGHTSLHKPYQLYLAL